METLHSRSSSIQLPYLYKRRLASFKLEDIHFMILEMRRAELVHWLSMIPIVVFIKSA
nr:hypothetical protein [Staphylococcus haemolyticus]